MNVLTKMKLSAHAQARVLADWHSYEKRPFEMWHTTAKFPRKPRNNKEALVQLLTPKYGKKASSDFVRRYGAEILSREGLK